MVKIANFKEMKVVRWYFRGPALVIAVVEALKLLFAVLLTQFAFDATKNIASVGKNANVFSGVYFIGTILTLFGFACLFLFGPMAYLKSEGEENKAYATFVLTLVVLAVIIFLAALYLVHLPSPVQQPLDLSGSGAGF